METILFLKGIYPISRFSISCPQVVAVIYYELMFFWIIKIEIEKATHLSLSFATLSRFSRFLKDAIYCLDIPSRRLRLNKYSMHRKVLFSSYWIAQNARFCSWRFFAIICSSYIRHASPRRKLIDSPYCSTFVWFCCPPLLSRPRMMQQQINTTEPEKPYTLYSSCRFLKAVSEDEVGKWSQE